MTPIDDNDLTAHLRRRADSGASPASLSTVADKVRASAAAQPQARRWPWTGDSPRRLRLQPAPGFAVALLGVTLVVATAITVSGRSPASPGGSPPPSQTASGPEAWFLPGNELGEVVLSGTATGAVVVADVADAMFALSVTDCANPGAPACSTQVVIPGRLGTHFQSIRVTGLDPAAGLPRPGHIAFRIGSGSVQYLGPVDDGPAGSGNPWPFGAAVGRLGQSASDHRLIVVNAWLSSFGGAPSCPAALDHPWDVAFGCGNAAWLTDASYQPEFRSAGGVSVETPSGAIRVQNDAYERNVVPNPTEVPGAGPPPQAGLYLLEPRAAIGGCFSCSAATAYLVARVTPVAVRVPLLPEAIPTSPATPGVPQGWLMDDPALVHVVRAAANGSGAGRVVVANVTFGLGGDCRGIPDPETCYPVVSGSDPPIRLVDPPSPFCPLTWRCAFKQGPYAPSDGPFALRLRDDGNVLWVDFIYTQSDGSVEWPFNEFTERLGRLQPTERDAYELYVVSGWITGTEVLIDCAQLPALPDRRFVCSDRPAWFTGSPPTSLLLVTGPPGSIRLQNDAVELVAPGAGLLAVHGTFVVRPVVPRPDPCDMCDSGLAAEVVGRLDQP